MGPSRPFIFLPLFLSVVACMSASLGSASSDLVESEFLKAPISEFANSARSTIDVVQQVATLVSTFAEFANSVRLTIEVVPQVASLVSTFTEFANAVRLTIEVVQQVASLVSRFAQFAISVRLTIEVVQKVASLVSRFARAFSEAIADCLDLLDLSAANSVFMNEMQNFTTLIVDMVKKEGLFASQGGPIILAQIENEYGNVISSYGYAGKAYRDWCANMAISQSIGVPWIMCQESDAPEPMINTCNGWYCDQFTPNRPSSPKMWTENWTRWFKNWGGLDPHRTAEDLAFSVARFFQTGGTFQNYYMYHGGTNFGRTAGGPYITTSYDYDAPLDEYGGLNQPKYGHLKQLHNVLKSMERTLTHGNITTNDLGNMVSVTIYATNETSSCFFGNANDSSDATVTFQGNDYNVAAWSVSILRDCKNEVYNTAKVNTQTSVMVKKTNEAENEPSALNWSWRPENTDKTIMLGQGHVSKTQLLDQKFIDDASDYLWYMTSVHIKKDDPIHSHNISIRVNGTGQVLHAYINGEYIGSEWATYGIFHYFFEKNIKLKQGKNQITLLSATIGLQNYGPQFDEINTGIPGPVQLIGRNGDETIIKDLSLHKWNYRVGLHGLNDELFSLDSRFAAKWQSDNLPTNQRMMWYKTTFQAPLGTDPVVVDMQGMGKGMAWVNGQSIGRYWPSYLAKEDGCSLEACDYRGTYDNNKCVTNCGQPTQRWYHVPRSFIPNDINTLVLFEEFGGNPAQVNFQTVAPGTVCGNAYEKNNMELSCEGRPISDIRFAGFGDVRGTCGSFKKGSCEGGNNPIDLLKTACLGKVSCSIQASDDVFGKSWRLFARFVGLRRDLSWRLFARFVEFSFILE